MEMLRFQLWYFQAKNYNPVFYVLVFQKTCFKVKVLKILRAS